jgi:hypothetical protein
MVSKRIEKVLVRTEAFKKRDYEMALIQAYEVPSHLLSQMCIVREQNAIFHVTDPEYHMTSTVSSVKF